MKMPAIQKIRVPVLLALACGEIAAIFILRGQPGFRVFLVTSLAVILLIPPLLWIQEIWRRNISYFVVAFVALGMALLFADLLTGRGLSSAPFCLLFYPLLILGLIRKGRFRSNDISDEQYRIRKAEDTRFFWVCINLAGIVSCFIYLAYHPDGKLANLPLPVAFLFLCGIVYCLFIKQTNVGSGIDSSQDKLGSGGRS